MSLSRAGVSCPGAQRHLCHCLLGVAVLSCATHTAAALSALRCCRASGNSSGLGTYLPHSFLFKSHNKLTLCTNGPSIPHLCGPMHAAPLGVGDGAAKSVNYTCVNYKLDGRKATFWKIKKKKKIRSSSSHSNEQKTHYPPL